MQYVIESTSPQMYAIWFFIVYYGIYLADMFHFNKITSNNFDHIKNIPNIHNFIFFTTSTIPKNYTSLSYFLPQTIQNIYGK